MLIGLLIMEGGEIINCGGRDGCDGSGCVRIGCDKRRGS